MKSTRLSLLRAKAVLFALVSVLAFSFSACNVTTEPEVEHVYKQIDADDLLVGTWTGGSTEWPESYTITNTTFESKGSYKGNNLVVQKLDSTSGYIYIKYTVAYLDKGGGKYEYSGKAPDVGKWYAIFYKDLGAEKISISGAGKVGGATSCETLDEAVTEFTVDNGYFDWNSSLTRQKSE